MDQEAADAVSGCGSENSLLVRFYKSSTESALKYFHAPNIEKVEAVFFKCLGIDVSKSLSKNNYDSVRACKDLIMISKKRGDIADRSWRPVAGQNVARIVTRENLGKHILFISDLARATNQFIDESL